MTDTELRVLLFAGRFEVRGSCAYTLRLAENLPARQVDVQVISSDAATVSPQRRDQLRIEEFHQLDLPLWGRVVMQLLRRHLAQKPPDLIHVQSRSMLDAGQWLADKLGRPWVLTVHDYLQRTEQLNIDRRWCRRIIAVSESVKSDLIRRTGLPETMVSVIPAGVGPLSGDPSRVLSDDHVPVVGTAGPLETVKGIPFFLGAAQRVLATHRDVEFVVAGAGPEEANLRRLTRELGIQDHVTFVPNLLDFSESLAAMDIFCLTSLQQGIGTTMLEAMAMGRPVIATRVGGVYGVVRDGENGLLVPPSDSGHLAERMLELLSDPDRARRLGAAARKKVEEDFSVERMVRRTAELYRQVTADHLAPAASAAP